MALKFNTFLLFFPLSINKLFKCQKYISIKKIYNNDCSELQDWVKAEKEALCAVLLPGE